MKTILILNFFDGLGSFYFHFFKFNVFILWPQLSIHVSRCRCCQVNVLMTWPPQRLTQTSQEMSGVDSASRKKSTTNSDQFWSNFAQTRRIRVDSTTLNPFLETYSTNKHYMLVFTTYIWWKFENNCIYTVNNIFMFIKVKNNCY